MANAGPLPNADRALIPDHKVRDYVLNPAHREGRAKAIRFRSMGFTRKNWGEFEAALRSEHLTQPTEPAGENQFGVKYTIEARLTGPSGESAMVRSVWIVLKGEDAPIPVTEYPVRN